MKLFDSFKGRFLALLGLDEVLHDYGELLRRTLVLQAWHADFNEFMADAYKRLDDLETAVENLGELRPQSDGLVYAVSALSDDFEVLRDRLGYVVSDSGDISDDLLRAVAVRLTVNIDYL